MASLIGEVSAVGVTLSKQIVPQPPGHPSALPQTRLSELLHTGGVHIICGTVSVEANGVHVGAVVGVCVGGIGVNVALGFSVAVLVGVLVGKRVGVSVGETAVLVGSSVVGAGTIVVVTDAKVGVASIVGVSASTTRSVARSAGSVTA